MALSLLGGVAKGFRVPVPPGDTIRPMSVRLKRRLFDAHQNLAGRHFVDLCAGSGAVGLEAWSRGAASVSFCEQNPRVYRLLQQTLRSFREARDCSLRPLHSVRGDCLRWLQQEWQGDQARRVDLIFFFAPPYPQHDLYHQVLQAITQGPFAGELWVESDRQKGFSLEQLAVYFVPQKIYRQGTTFVCCRELDPGL